MCYMLKGRQPTLNTLKNCLSDTEDPLFLHVDLHVTIMELVSCIIFLFQMSRQLIEVRQTME